MERESSSRNHKERLHELLANMDTSISSLQILFRSLVSDLQVELSDTQKRVNSAELVCISPVNGSTDSHRDGEQGGTVVLQEPLVLTKRWEALEKMRPAHTDEPAKTHTRSTLGSNRMSSGSHKKDELHPRWKDAQATAEEELRRHYEDVTHSVELGHCPSFASDPMMAMASRLSVTVFLHCVINPYSPAGLLRHLIGASLILTDVLWTPVSISWGFMMQQSAFDHAISWAVLVYWSLDLLTNFWTGFYENGQLVNSTYRVVRHYVFGWFSFDMLMVSIDIFLVGFVQRGLTLRILRFTRLLRILKLHGILHALNEICSLQNKFVVILMAIARTFLGIVLVDHGLACIWYLLGRSRRERGYPSWLDQLDSAGTFTNHDDYVSEYLASFHWVFGQFTPAPNRIYPSNAWEFAFNIFVIFFALLVMGTVVSTMSTSISKLKSFTQESAQQKNQLRAYLRREKVPLELAVRIITFADFLLKERASTALDSALIPAAHKEQIVFAKRRDMLSKHPLFNLIQLAKEEVFCQVCNSFDKHVHIKDTTIFSAGSRSSHLQVTVKGVFVVGTRTPCSDIRFFAEPSLYMNYLYRASLSALTHAETFTLTGSSFEHSLATSPICTLLVCDYARRLLKYQETELLSDAKSSELAQEICKETEIYQMLHLPLELNISRATVETVDAEASSLVGSDLNRLLTKEFSKSDLLRELEAMFPEIAGRTGLFDKFFHPDERYRAVASMFSVVWLLRDRYSEFTSPQPHEVRMSWELWGELQAFVQWIGGEIDHDILQAVFFFLAIRGLEKVQLIIKQLPLDFQQPQKSVIYIMQNHANLVPSVLRLSNDARTLVVETLMLHQEFNLAQFLQAENLPASIDNLQRFTDSRRHALLHCYLLSLLGMMAGLQGGVDGDSLYGSKFLDEQKTRNLLLCLNSLRQLREGTPSAIYWNYIISRGDLMHLPSASLGDLAFLRLVCLSRTENLEAVHRLRNAWNDLEHMEKNSLISALVADGIHETAFIFAFLPLCFERAQSNAVIGLSSMLQVFAELVDNVNAHWRNGPAVHVVTRIDLSDLANFIASVKDGSVFWTCIARSSITCGSDGLKLVMTMSNWDLVDSARAPDPVVTQTLRQILQCVQCKRLNDDDLDEVRQLSRLSRNVRNSDKVGRSLKLFVL